MAANYYEIYLCSGKLDNVYTVGMSAEEFERVLKRLTNSNYRFFQKEYKEYIYGDIISQNYKNTEILVHGYKHIGTKYFDGYLMIAYNRSKLTFLSVPSTTNIYSMNYVKKLIFRVSNRIFINFKISQAKDSEKIYEVYINYNHESNIDQEQINATLEQVFATLGLKLQESIF